MSQLKRRDKNRKDGKPYRPRSAWKQQRDRIPKKTKPKPCRIERRIVDWGTTPADRRRLMAALLKGFSTAEGWQRLGRHHPNNLRGRINRVAPYFSLPQTCAHAIMNG